MSATAAPSSDSALGALAARYGLVQLDQLVKAGSSAAALVEAGHLTPEQLAFLERKAAGDEAFAGSFLEAAVHRGYLTELTASKYASKLRSQGLDRDYEAACLLFNQEVLPLHQVIDVLEVLDRPLQFGTGAQVAYFPPAPDAVDADAVCPTTGHPLVALTTLPERGLDAAGLPQLDRLVAVRLDPRVQDRQAGSLVLQLARHYRLITPEQAELLSDEEQFDTVQSAVQYLFEEGLLTTTAFRFLLARAETVLEHGSGIVGYDAERPLLELVLDNDYLTPESLDSFLEEWQVTPEANAGIDPQALDMAVIALLFNRGFILQYQAIDLLEKRGIVLDHSRVGEYQLLGKGDKPRPCPESGAPMVRLTGWASAAQLKRPLPEITQLLVHDMGGAPIAAEAVEEPAADASGLDGSMILNLTSASPATAEVAQIAPEEIRALLERYHMLEPEKLAKAMQIQQRTEQPLFQVLREFGYVGRRGTAFLKRKLGITPADHPTEGGLLAIATHYGYVRVDGSTERSTREELRVLGSAFNKGGLTFWQLMDCIEAKELWIEHSPDAQMQVYWETGEREPGSPVKLPKKLGEMVPLCMPGGVKGVLPLPERIRIAKIASPKPAAASEPKGQVEAVAPAAAAPADEPQLEVEAEQDKPDTSADPLAAQIVLRYGLVPRKPLNRAYNAWQKAGAESELAGYLFERGLLTKAGMEFLLHKEEQFAGGEVQAGAMADERLADIAQAKGYVARKRLAKLFRLAGAPDAEEGDDLQIGCYLLARGALKLYQLIDLFEEKGYFLLTRKDLSKQYHLAGEVDPTLDYADPETGRLLKPLTSAPGYPPRLERLPTIEAFNLERRSALPILEEGQTKLPGVKRTAEDILDATSLDGSVFGLSLNLLEINLDGDDGAAAKPKPPAKNKPAPRRGSLTKQQSAAQASRDRSKAAVQSFYDKALPDRKLKTRPKKDADRFKINLSEAVGLRNEPDLRRVRKANEEGAEKLQAGAAMLSRSLLTFAGILAVLFVVGMVIAHYQGIERRKQIDEQTAERKQPKVEKRAKPEPGAEIMAFGMVEASSLHASSKSFRLQVDFGKSVVVQCTSESAQLAFDSLAGLLREAQASGKPLLVRASGTAAERGNDIVVQASDVRVWRKELPSYRLRY